MRTLLLALLVSGAAWAQDLQFFVASTNAPLSATTPYQFADTPVGQSSSVTIRITNASTTDTVSIAAVILSASPDASSTASGFTISGAPIGITLAPGTSAGIFTVTFAPSATGSANAYVLLQLQTNGPFIIISPLQGNGTASQLQLACSGCSGTSINFGTVAVGSSNTMTLTLTNTTSADITTPTITPPQTSVYATPQFSIDTSSLPATIDANSSVSFTATFTPIPDFLGPSANPSATFQIGSQSYTMLGISVPPTGTPVNSDGLQVTFTDGTGTQVDSGALQLGPTATSLTLKCTVLNPNPANTPDATITLAGTPTVSNPAFTLSTFTLGPSAQGVTGSSNTAAAGQSVAIPPGWALTFTVSFASTQTGAATGTLTIPGVMTYTLSGQAPPQLGSPNSDLPGITLICGASPCKGQTFSSQQQVEATLQLSTPSTGSATLALSFSPSVAGVQDDPAVTFIAPVNTRNIGPINFSQSSTTGTFSGGGSQFTFQTGTTAGTITFTLTDALTQQTLTLPPITIPPAQVQITSGQAVRQGTNLVITLSGYDNTYSAGQLSFAFSTTTAGIITIPVDATSNFHQYFFGPSDVGGTFALQASFPVGGDPTQVGSVTVNLTNSAGQASTTQTFQ